METRGRKASALLGSPERVERLSKGRLPVSRSSKSAPGIPTGELIRIVGSKFTQIIGPLKPLSCSHPEDRTVERRVAPRVELLSHAFYWAYGVEGCGELHDVSMTGARIEEASTPMKPGTKLRVTFRLKECGTAIQLWANVVRETETGFAVQFLEMDRLLEESLHRVTSEFDV